MTEEERYEKLYRRIEAIGMNPEVTVQWSKQAAGGSARG